MAISPRMYCRGNFSAGHRRIGRPMLRFKDVCKCDMKITSIDTNSWETFADDRSQCSTRGNPQWRRAPTARAEEQKKAQEGTTARPQHQPAVNLRLQQLWQGLPCKNWTPESHQTLQHQERMKERRSHCLPRQKEPTTTTTTLVPSNSTIA